MTSPPTRKHLFLSNILRSLWDFIRWPLAAFLILIEPCVTAVLATLAALGLGMALLFSAALPNHPTVRIDVLVGVSIACIVAIFAYVGVIAWLQQDST